MELIETILGAIVIGGVGFLINRVFHYRRLWLYEKNKVSWTMSSDDPHNWAVQRSFSYDGSDNVEYDVIDLHTKSKVATNFRTKEDAVSYIQMSKDHVK